jgi:hypothetical protein
MYEKLYMVSLSMKQEAHNFSGGCVTSVFCGGFVKTLLADGDSPLAQELWEILSVLADKTPCSNKRT